MFFPPTCLHCDYSPCSVDAAICPRCGHANPNPGFTSRSNEAIGGFVTAAWIAVVGAVFAIPGWMMHPYIGVAIGAFVVFCAIKAVFMGIWYAIDPTYSIVPAVRSSHG